MRFKVTKRLDTESWAMRFKVTRLETETWATRFKVTWRLETETWATRFKVTRLETETWATRFKVTETGQRVFGDVLSGDVTGYILGLDALR